jgi:LL-diaminopimelate aminotransferase
MIVPARRMEKFSMYFFAGLSSRLAQMAAAGVDVIRLDEGAPDLPPAPHIIDALVSSARQPDRHSYQPHRGPVELRAAWAAMYQRLYGVEIDPKTEVMPILGSKEGIFHLAMAYVEPGDIVLAPDPGYITYTRGAWMAGGEVYSMPIVAENSYLPDLEAIPPEILQRVKLIWLNYPNNPTAATAPREFFIQAVEFAHRHNLLLCHDAAYAQVTYDGYQAPSLLEIPGAKKVAVEFNTLSKSHNMAGWRTGALLGNHEIVHTFHTLKTSVDSSHFLPIMEATTAALTSDQSWLVERNAIYQQRRDALVMALHDLGLQVQTPQASLYIWCPVPQGWRSTDFATSALEQAHVSLTPGTVFGPHGEGFVRISVTTPLEKVIEAGERLKSVFGR